MMKSYWGGVGPQCKMSGVLTREKERLRKKYPQEEDSHVMTEREIKVVHLEAKEHQGLLANIRS